MAKLFDINAGERRVVALLLLHSLFMGISLVLFETAANAIFLARFPADLIPYVFIGAAVAVPVSGVLYNRLRNHLSTPQLWTATLVFLLSIPLAITPAISAGKAAWPVLILMISVNVMYAMTALEFWGIAGGVLNMRQARRLYGLVGSGETAAGILGGIAVGPILKIITVTNLLLVAAGGFFLCLLILRDLLRIAPQRSDEDENEDDSVNQSIGALLRAVLKDRYILLIVGLYFFYNLTHDTLEYTNLTQIQAHFHQNENQVAAFIGGLLSAREIITLIARTLLSGWLINRFGLGAGLAATPALMIGGAATLVVVSLVLPGLPLFWFVVFLKVAEGTVRNSLNKPSVMVAYRPLAPQRRDRAQLVIETAIEPLSTGFTGAVLIVVNLVLAGASQAHKTVGTGLLLLATAGGWLAMARWLRQDYTKVVMAALSRGSLRAVVLALDEPTLKMLTGKLHTSCAAEVIYLLNVMRENMAPAKYSLLLPGLLDHSDEEVRVAVLRRIEELKSPAFFKVLWEKLRHETVPQVRAALLRAVAACGGLNMLGQISIWLRDPAPVMRRSALAAMLKYGGKSGAAQGGEHWSSLLQSPEPGDRKMAAEVAGDVTIPSFYDSLRPLLTDPDTGVRVATLEAAGALKHAPLWPEVVRQLASPAVWQHASRALEAGGDGAIPAIAESLQRSGAGRAFRCRCVRVLGRIRTASAIPALLTYLGDSSLRQEVARALVDCGYTAVGEAGGDVEAEFLREMDRAAGLNAALVDLGQDEKATILRQTVRQELTKSLDILFSLLAFLYHPDSMRQARVFWRSGSPEKKAFALEVLDNLCERRHKACFLPLVEGNSPAFSYRKLNKRFPQPLFGLEGRLAAILTEPPEWATSGIKAWAAYTLTQTPTPEAAALLKKMLGARETLVAEAARLVLQSRRSQNATEQNMLLTIEKILLLKSVEFFSTTSDDVLVEVAALATEVPVQAGQRIIEMGRVEWSMYVIAEGELRVHQGDRHLGDLARGGVFGELATLDPQPRSADVTAKTDGILLKIDHSTVVDLMAENIEVAHGIIRFLIRRYRASAVSA